MLIQVKCKAHLQLTGKYISVIILELLKPKDKSYFQMCQVNKHNICVKNACSVCKHEYFDYLQKNKRFV